MIAFNAYTALLFSGPITLDTLGRGLIGMLDEVLARKIDEPDMDLGANEVVTIVTKLVELDGMDQ
jgi:ATP-dependent RNA helicase DHX57